MDAAFDLRAGDYKRKGISPVVFFLISHQLHLDTEILFQAFERSTDYVLIRTQTGCGRAGTGEGEVLWTQRDCGAL